MSNYDDEAVIALARHLLPDDPSLITEISATLPTPSEHAPTVEDLLDHSDIDKSGDGLPWIALVDGLAARGRLFEIDGKAVPEDVIWCIKKLLQQHVPDEQALHWLETIPWPDEMPHKLLPVIGRELRKHDLALIALDMGSDSYPLMIIKIQKVSVSQQIAQQAGYDTIENYSADADTEHQS